MQATKIIAHRGNLDGPSPDRENTNDYLRAALDAGFDVECDVWLVDGQFRLGHEAPGEVADGNLLRDDRVWVHAKNPEALERLLFGGAHCFFHESDHVTLTSRGFVWCYVGRPVAGYLSVQLLPEVAGTLDPCYAYCTDFAHRYRGEIRVS